MIWGAHPYFWKLPKYQGLKQGCVFYVGSQLNQINSEGAIYISKRLFNKSLNPFQPVLTWFTICFLSKMSSFNACLLHHICMLHRTSGVLQEHDTLTPVEGEDEKVDFQGGTVFFTRFSLLSLLGEVEV